MRGVFLEKGEAIVEFRFEPPVTALYISLAAIVAGVVLLGMMVLGSGPRSGSGHEHKDKQADPRPTSGPGPRRNV